MRQLTRIFAIVTVAMLLVACDPAGNVGPGLQPGLGDYTSNQPNSGTVPCVDGTNCAIIPDPYGVIPPKDLTPKITFPEYSASTPVIPVLPGNASSLLVSTANISDISVVCEPAATVSLTSTGIPGGYLLYLGSMLSKDVTCTLSGNGDKSSATAKLIFKPAPSDYVEKLEVRNLPTQITVNGGESVVLNNFYVRGYDKTTKLNNVTCTSGQIPALVNVAGKLGWYSMVVVAPGNVGLTESCTVSATRASDGQTAKATVKISTPDIKFAPSITAGNFQEGSAAPMIPGKFEGHNYLALTGPYKDQPLPRVKVHNLEDAPELTISCTDTHKAGFVPPCDASLTCEQDPAYVQCKVPCGAPGEKGYNACVNNCFTTLYIPCAEKACPLTNYPSKVTGLGKMASPPNPEDTYEFELVIHYKDIGTPDGVDTCTLTAVNNSGGKASYTMKVQHVIPILKPQGQIVNTGAEVWSEVFAVTPYDNATNVTVTCTSGNAPPIKQQIPGGKNFYFTTTAPSKIGDSNVCTVMVAHGTDAPTAYRTMTVTPTQ